MSIPMVSVIIPVYNAEKYIEETLRSIFAQSYKDYEIIVVDDGSTDRTAEILEPYKDRIRYIYQENSGGPATPRNRAIRESKSKYISIFDADDLMFPEKLASNVKVLEENPEAAMVFSNFQPFGNTELKVPWLSQPHIARTIAEIPKRNCKGDCLLFDVPIYDQILANNFIGTSTVTAKRDALIRVGFFDENLIGIEDRDMWLRLARQGELFACSMKVLSQYRMVRGSISRLGKTLFSHICYYEKMLQGETLPGRRGVIKKRLGYQYYEYGFRMKNQGDYVKALSSYWRSLQYGNIRTRYLAVISSLKIPIFVALDCFRKKEKQSS